MSAPAVLHRVLLFIAFSAAASAVGAQGAALVSTRSVESAPVVAVQSTRVTDLVLFGAGFESGYRQGMICTVSRSGALVAEILLVELRARAGAGIILDVAPGKAIQAGDLVSVKTLKV